MADVATAPTATAEQTRAAGSRMLGYYLSGGVKVDALHDVANFLTKDASGNYIADHRLDVSADDQIRARVRIRNTAPGGRTYDIVSGLHNAAQGAFSIYDVSAAATMFIISTNNDVTPGADNEQKLGSAYYRWSAVYAGTGTINTSDARDKAWRGAPSAAELAAAKRIAAELGFYRWSHAIAEKGPDDARLHFGVRAQAVWAIMADEGLVDPIAEGARPDCRYAFLCHDEWDAVEAVEEVRDEEGHVVTAARPDRPAGSRFGIRPDQLALFLIAAQEARLAALEAAA